MKGLVFPVAVLIVLQIAATFLGIRSDNLAAPAEIIQAGAEAALDGSVLTATFHTLRAALGGLAIGGGIGLAMGILLGLSDPLRRLLFVSLETLRPVPSVAFIPIAMMVFGLGYRMEIAIIAFACTWPILIMGRAAILGIHPRLLEVSYILKLRPLAHVWKIVLPAALPRLFVGFRLAAGVALIVAVTVEVTANPFGLGYAVMAAQQSFRPARMFAILVWIGVIGWSVNALLLFAQHRLFGRVGSAS